VVSLDSLTSIKVISGSIAAVLLFTDFLIVFRQYLKKKYSPSLYLSLAWLGFFLEVLFSTIALSFGLNTDLWLLFQKFSYLSLTPGFLGILALYDSISRDSIEPKSFALLIFVLGANSLIISVITDYNLMIIPNIIVKCIGLIISNATFILYIQIYRRVPQSLKRLALLNVIGSFFVSVLFVIVNIVESAFPNLIPPVARIIEAVGALIQASIFSRYEQLFYVLPFKVQKLIVYGTSKGISLFTYEWSKSERFIDEDMFTSILQGVGMIVNESLKKGNVQEIKMEQGVLLISHDDTHPVASVLIASKSSQVLRDGLTAFARQFVKMFEVSLDHAEKPERFNNAIGLVHSCFPFIPQYE